MWILQLLQAPTLSSLPLALTRLSRLPPIRHLPSTITCAQRLLAAILWLRSSSLGRLYNGTHSVYTHTFSLDSKEHCPVCGGEAIEISRPAASTLQELIDFLLADASLQVTFTINLFEAHSLLPSQIKRPSLMAGVKQIYMQAPEQLKKATAPNLEKKLGDLIASEADITVTDTNLPFGVSLRISLT